MIDIIVMSKNDSDAKCFAVRNINSVLSSPNLSNSSNNRSLDHNKMLPDLLQVRLESIRERHRNQPVVSRIAETFLTRTIEPYLIRCASKPGQKQDSALLLAVQWLNQFLWKLKGRPPGVYQQTLKTVDQIQSHQ